MKGKNKNSASCQQFSNLKLIFNDNIFNILNNGFVLYSHIEMLLIAIVIRTIHLTNLLKFSILMV